MIDLFGLIGAGLYTMPTRSAALKNFWYSASFGRRMSWSQALCFVPIDLASFTASS